MVYLARNRMIFGRARPRHDPDEMNGLERAYSLRLELLKQRGEILDWKFQPEKLRLAKKTYYTPDFRVIAADGVIEMHETKGHWEDDARVKIKVAAELHPYRFFGVKKLHGDWDLEAIEGRE